MSLVSDLAVFAGVFAFGLLSLGFVALCGQLRES
jgi:hypothetical protein